MGRWKSGSTIFRNPQGFGTGRISTGYLNRVVGIRAGGCVYMWQKAPSAKHGLFSFPYGLLRERWRGTVRGVWPGRLGALFGAKFPRGSILHSFCTLAGTPSQSAHRCSLSFSARRDWQNEYRKENSFLSFSRFDQDLSGSDFPSLPAVMSILSDVFELFLPGHLEVRTDKGRFSFHQEDFTLSSRKPGRL
jgi:hypothetical protein